MIRLKRLILHTVLLLLASTAFGQIKGVVNKYLEIKKVYNKIHNDLSDSVEISPSEIALAGLKYKDTVLIYQPQVTESFFASENDDWKLNNEYYLGKFEFLKIDTIIEDSIVIFTKPLSYDYVGSYSYNTFTPLQLIKVAVYKNVTVDSTLTASNWNGEKGGLLALIVSDTLKLNANIDVSEKGFRGAKPTILTLSQKPTCIEADQANLKKGYIKGSNSTYAGLKGEGFYPTPDSMARGWAGLSNAGSGGNGYFAGGSGGGGRYASGGKGGWECDSCSSDFKYIIAKNEYSSTKIIGDPLKLSAIMGGGGGSSLQYQTYNATAGGNGGGICIILAGAIIGNGFSIKADGQSVIDTAFAGAGGGGGGGNIFLDVASFNPGGGNLIVSARGGNGGKTKGSAGPGGGGGGGRLNISGTTYSIAGLKYVNNFIGGKGGFVINNDTINKALGGQFIYNTSSLPYTGYISPLNGFVFNDMPNDQNVCEGNLPDTLIGSKVNSESSVFYTWVKSENKQKWDSVGNEKDFIPSPLYITTYFKRAVKFQNPFGNHEYIDDTSSIVTINVYNNITNNTIFHSDSTICQGSNTGRFTASLPLGADHPNYKYNWQFNFDTTKSWSNIGSVTDTNFTGMKLDSSVVWIRRVVKSSACVSNSKKIKIIGLKQISNNSIDRTQWVQENYKPLKLIGSTPQNGDNQNYYYKWMKKSEKGTFIDTSNIDTLNKDFDPGLLTDTTWFKRVVYSGLNNCCVSYSDSVTIHVLKAIQNNTIVGNETICQYSNPKLFTDNGNLSGGDKIYRFIWQKKGISDQQWITLNDTSKTIQYGSISEKTEFRRIALSGETDACRDTTKQNITITTIQAISNNNISQDTIICFGQNAGKLVGDNNLSAPNPIYTFEWEQSSNATHWLKAKDKNTDTSYVIGVLDSTTYFRRIVISDLCKSISETIKVLVLPLIGNNTISEIDTLCRGTKSPLTIASSPTGGNTIYSYRWLTKTGNNAWFVSGTDSSLQPITISDRTIYKRLVMSGLHDCCKDTSAEKTIEVFQLPTAILSNLVDSVCVGQSYLLKPNLTGQQPWKIKYSENSTESFFQTQSDRPSIEVKPSGVVDYKIVSLSDGNNCEAVEMAGNVKVTVIDWPNPKAGDDLEVCGLTAQLNAEKTIIGSNYWTYPYAIFKPDTFNPKATITVSNYGKHTLYYTIRNSWCHAIDTINVTFYEQPPVYQAGEEQAAPFMFSTTLDARPASVGKAQWIANNKKIIFVDSLDHKTEVQNLSLGKNYLYWVVKNGACNIVSDSVLVNVKDIRIPEGFSPNNDNVNDVFEIRGLNNVTNAQLVVYNQWGVEVYRNNDYKNDWNGVSKGSPLPDGTYLYVVNVIGRTYKGFVVLKK